MDLHTHYSQTLRKHGYSNDPAQLTAVEALEKVRSALCRQSPYSGWRSHLRQWLPLIRSELPPVKGAYLWGGVGRGKTFVMDMFYESLQLQEKRRYHFHRLMYRIHGQLRLLTGAHDPIATVAEELASQARVLCFDEFFVSDIGDAMILGRLLDRLFSKGVTLVATSNIPPDELYRDGLQRQQFLPAIDLLKKHTEIIHLDAGSDYRLRTLEQVELWHVPLDAEAEANLGRYFSTMAGAGGNHEQQIEILGRNIHVRQRADGVAWFDFATLCDGPRSQDDYIELARIFQTVLLSAVPVMGPESENQARRFIALIDEFYERKVKLIVSAAAPIQAIYEGERLQNEFRRTLSRLNEMQSRNYLSQAHIP